MKPARAWAGVVDLGKGPRIPAEMITDVYGAAYRPELFASRLKARERYQKVVRVEIREVRRRKKGKS